ncbi:MAG: hypothetical protein ABSH04_04820 [Acidimicrobiales bacterium]|jgi:hypothetical protein
MPSEFEEGVMVGLLIGDGHFGGDGRQPHVTLRMHVRHEALLRWIDRNFPGGRVYGPYHHDGRHYLQWMARGAYLRDHLVPFLERCLSPLLDEYSWNRFDKMRRTYVKHLGILPEEAGRASSPAITTRGPGQPTAGAALPGAEVSKRVDEVFERLRKARAGHPWDFQE